MKSTSQPFVSFIIVGWNNQDIIGECIESVQSQTYSNHKVIYVDNGSTDGSVAYVREKYPNTAVIDNKVNQGFAIGNNIGIREALQNVNCQYIALLNSDARIAKNWLETLVSFALSHPQSGSFQTPTYDFYDHAVLDSYGITIDHFGRAMQLGYRSRAKRRENQKVFGVNAAAALFSRKFLDQQPFKGEYFDEDMWMYLEDVDIAARATIMGWSNWLVAESAAYHMGSASSGKNPGFSVYYIYRNSFPMLYKNLPFSVLMRILPGLVGTDIVTIVNLLRGRNKVALVALIKGRLSGIKLLITIHKKRLKLRQVARVNSKELWQLMKNS